MTRRSLGAAILGLVFAAFAWTLAAAPSEAAEHHCHAGKTCPAPHPAKSTPANPRPTQAAAAFPTLQDTPSGTPGPLTGVVTTPAGLRSVPPPIGLIPAPHPAGDLTLVILLVIVGLSMTAIVACVLAISVT
jgi:hypothetical protein